MSGSLRYALRSAIESATVVPRKSGFFRPVFRHASARLSSSCIERERRSEVKAKGDFYFNVPAFIRYYENPELGGCNLNSASLSTPPEEVRNAAKKYFAEDEVLNDSGRIPHYESARNVAARLINFCAHPKQVVLGRNTTEAASTLLGLVGLEPNDRVLLSCEEYPSITKIFTNRFDHRTLKGGAGSSSWPRFFSKQQTPVTDFAPSATGVRIATFDPNLDHKGMERELRRTMTPETALLLVSHVRRDTGQLLPVKEIIECARATKAVISSRPLFVVVDGAQALGNRPEVDFNNLKCDAYLASPHKTMQSEVVGLMFVAPQHDLTNRSALFNRLSPVTEQAIPLGMFSPSTNIESNVQDRLSLGDVAVLPTTIDYLEKTHGLKGSDFSTIDQRRGECKSYLEKGLAKLRSEKGFEIRVLPRPNQTNLIMNFQVLGVDQRALAEALSERRVFVTYIERDAARPTENFYRVSFQPDTTREQIDTFIRTLDHGLQQTRTSYSGPSASSGVDGLRGLISTAPPIPSARREAGNGAGR